jgi:hypothetical protein
MQRLMRNRIQTRNRSLRGLWFALFFLVGCPSFAVTFTASLDRTSIILGEQVVLTLKCEGARAQQFSNPALDGIQVLSGLSESSYFSSVQTAQGTVQSMVYSYTIALQPTRAGNFVIPPITAKVNGQEMKSQPLSLTVAASEVSAPPAEYGEKMAFLWIVLPRTNLYLNEPMVGEIRIYLRSDVRRPDNPEQIMPQGHGLTFSQFVPGQQYSRRVGNATFTVVPISIAITPIKTGTVSIDPINGSIALNNLTQIERMWGDAPNPVRAPLTTPQMDLQVSPLPKENVPPGFNGAVGSFTMAVSAGPTNLVTGDPITLRVQISGHGALDTIALPELTGWDNFKIYPPTAKVDAINPLGIDGSKTFEEIVTPQNSDIKTLPPVSFSFFDPVQKQYRTLTYPATPLVVRAATPGTMPAAPTAAHPENAQPTPDVVPLKQHLGELAQIRPPLMQQPWFLTLQGVPVLALVSSVIWRKRKENLANNPRLRRQRQVAQIVREGLQQLHRLAAENKSDEFFAALFRLLQEQLGERLDLPASAITEAVIDERLRPRGVPSETLASLHELFQLCNLARYAPIKSSQELAAIIPKLESALNQLREMKV